jgi:carbonic anhydrase
MFDDLLTANDEYARRQTLAGLPREPAKQLLVLTCMDARIDTLAILGLRPGDAHVLRNAGGRVSDDAIRSMLVSTRLLGVTNVVVMHHTGCGMADISKRDVQVLLGDIADEHLEFFDLLEIDDQLQALRDDVNTVRESPLLPPLDVAGFLYDVSSGRVERVV